MLNIDHLLQCNPQYEQEEREEEIEEYIALNGCEPLTEQEYLDQMAEMQGEYEPECTGDAFDAYDLVCSRGY
jgi:hypothetical protein